MWRAVLLAASAGVGMCCLSLALDTASAGAAEREPDGSSLVAEVSAVPAIPALASLPAGLTEAPGPARPLPAPPVEVVPIAPVTDVAAPAPIADVVETVEAVPPVVSSIVVDAIDAAALPPLDPPLLPPVELPLPDAAQIPSVGGVDAVKRVGTPATVDAADTSGRSLDTPANAASPFGVDTQAHLTTANAPDVPVEPEHPVPGPAETVPGQPRSASAPPGSGQLAAADLAGRYPAFGAGGLTVPSTVALRCPAAPTFDPGCTPD